MLFRCAKGAFPLKRRLFNLSAAMSLVLCAATVAMWVRTHFAYDELRITHWNESTHTFSVPQCFTNAGKLIVASTSCSASAGDDVSLARATAGQRSLRSSHSVAPSRGGFWPIEWNHSARQGGFGFVNLHGSGDEWRVVIHLWLAALLF